MGGPGSGPQTHTEKQPTKKYDPATATIAERVVRAEWFSKKAEDNAKKAKYAPTALEAKKFALIAAASAKHADNCAAKAMKMAKTPEEKSQAQEAKNHAVTAAGHAKGAGVHADNPPTATFKQTLKENQDKIKPAKESNKAHDDDEYSETGFPSKAVTFLDKSSGKSDKAELESLTKSGLAHLSDHELDKYRSDHAAKLLSSEKAAITTWAGSDHKYISQGLRNPPPSESYKATIAKLDVAVAKGSAPRDMVVFRGQGQNPQTDNIKPGGIYSDKSFMATSASIGTAKGFDDRVVFHIHVDKGQPCAPAHKGERELLMPRDTKLKILTVEKNGKDYSGKDKLIIHAKIMAE